MKPSEYKISNGNTKLSVGDNVVLITVAEESKKILSYFSDNED